MRETVFLFISFVITSEVYCQSIHGIVVDKSSRAPISGALIGVQNQTLVTNSQGEFSCFSEQEGPIELIIQAIGYSSKTVQARPESFITIPLEINELELSDVIITSTHLGTSSDLLPASVSMITPGALKRNDNISLPLLLNQVPGVFVHQGTLGTNRITIRGLGTRNPFGTSKIRAYYEDIPLTNGSGETTLEDLDLATIGRAEVVKGPNSSLFGAGLGGVIKLLPRYPEANEQSAQSGFQYGSFHTYRWFNRFELGQENGSLSLIHSRIKSDGYRDNNSYYRESLTALGSWHPDEKTRISAIGNFTYLKSFIPSSIGYTPYKNSPKSAAANWVAAKGFEQYTDQKAGVNLTRYMTSQVHVSASAFYNHHNNNEPRPRPLHILRDETHGFGFRVSGNYEAAKNQFSIGTETYYDILDWKVIENLYDNMGSGTIEGNLLSNQKGKRGYVNFFSEWKTDLASGLHLIAGANLNQSFYRLEDQFLPDSVDISGSYTYKPIFSPRVGLVYQLDAASIFGNISHGFSTPTLEETLLPDGAINHSIGPERGWNFETGIRGSVQNLSYETNFYWIEINDLLVSRRNASDQFVGINAGKTRNLGVEQSLSYTLLNGRTRHLVLYGNASFQDFQFLNFIDDDADYSGNQLTGVPRYLANAGIDYSSEKGPYANINFRYAGKMPITDDNSISSGDYALLNLKLGYSRSFKYWDVDGYVGVQNLTGAEYASMIQVNAQPIGGAEPRYYYPGLPRNYYSGLSLKFRI